MQQPPHYYNYSLQQPPPYTHFILDKRAQMMPKRRGEFVRE